MKKIFLPCLIALLTLTPNISAQSETTPDETYSMTIKLKDGTAFTISTDDLIEMSFNNGQLSFSGPNIVKILTTIDNQQKIDEKQNDQIINLISAVAVLEEKINHIVTAINILDDRISTVQSQYAIKIASLETDMLTIKTQVVQLENSIRLIETMMASLEARIRALSE